MVLSPRARGLAAGVTLALALGVGLGVAATASNGDDGHVFGSDAGLVLFFVAPDQTDVFEGLLAQLRSVLEASDDLIRQQQAEHWRMFRSPEPGPNGSVLYVGHMQPVLKGADYDFADVLLSELPEPQARLLINRLAATMMAPPDTLQLDTIVDLSEPMPDPSDDDAEPESDIASDADQPAV